MSGNPYVSAMPPPTQRRLILVRHAKALEDHGSGDHSRHLSERGRADAAALGAWLTAEGLLPEQVYCSTATRTRETLAGICGQAEGINLPTMLREKIYMASTGDLVAQLQGADDAVRSLMLIGHNPGMHGLLALLAGTYATEADADRVILKFPTAGCAVLSIAAPSWKDIAPQSGRLEQLRWSADG